MTAAFILVFFSMLRREAVFAREIGIPEDDWPKPSPVFKVEPPILINFPKPPNLSLPAPPIIASPEPSQLETPKPSISIPAPYPVPIASPGVPSRQYPDPDWKPTPPPEWEPPASPEPAIADPPSEFSKAPPESEPDYKKTVKNVKEAVERARRIGIIDEIIPQQMPESIKEKGIPAYEVQGTKQEKVLGIIPITIAKTVIVSSSDGNIVSVRTSFLQKLLDFISF